MQTTKFKSGNVVQASPRTKFYGDFHPWITKILEVVKITKGGLVEVKDIDGDVKGTYSLEPSMFNLITETVREYRLMTAPDMEE